ncbi:unnamed protein product [Adineta steineri]|uniref:LITAF domain-containing protein n=1 Tax=Adineta steineri TaxID=433720 RepID=A0A816BEQ2_9BILA|nr:unnamed protein product [Adineta steineri]CAF1609871.1 unnamed protein product [Adineta steineri]
MAGAIHPQDMTSQSAPPPYSVYDESKDGVPYQQQGSPPTHASNFGIPPQPIPVYTQTTFLQPMMTMPLVSRSPMHTQCPRCHQQIITNVQYETGGGTWLIAFLICLFGGVFGCCLIPLCITDCQDAIHSCPACHNHIARRNVF